MGRARILLVEDSRSQAKAAKDFLEKNGYEVILAKNGKTAIKTVKTARVDIILLDLVLPDMNGNEVCRWLKLNEDTKEIPIIMLTVKGEVADKVAGLKAGADDYLPKPYNNVELNARIYACLRTKALQDGLKQKNLQLQNLLKQVEIMAITDQLTGIYNRRQVETILQKEFKTASRYQTPISCMIIDIDHFKAVNDALGHHTGDAVLKEIAKLIMESAREADIVARWGGDEFIVILPQTKKEEALQAASRIVKAISEHDFQDSPNERITVSIGVTSIPHPSLNIDTEEKLIHTADCALYEAKRNGRRIESI
ncbi:MAG TPA: diguanylate cyclase response regulator [Nitrospiraceae bacterium]|nr:diguanylate cyclase response regulator [Nitrospiraceae bacterium]